MKSGFVAIVGRPNAGKSTLLNTALGAKLAVVTPKAQTTRERVLGILTEKDRQIIFVDTPGIHKARPGGINEFMVNEAAASLDAPSAVWYLVDPSSSAEFEKPVIELLARAGCPVFVLVNKADLSDNGVPADRFSMLAASIETAVLSAKISVHSVRRISAKKEEGISELLSETVALLPEGPLYYPPSPGDPDSEAPLSDRPTRYFVSEMIREQLLLCLGEELPYSCAVEIETYDEAKTPPRIEAVIHVERDSQKGMVIGKAGAKIKEIGLKSRKTIETFVGHQIFLGLRVKVLKDWTKDPDALRRLGYAIVAPKKRAPLRGHR